MFSCGERTFPQSGRCRAPSRYGYHPVVFAGREFHYQGYAGVESDARSLQHPFKRV